MYGSRACFNFLDYCSATTSSSICLTATPAYSDSATTSNYSEAFVAKNISVRNENEWRSNTLYAAVLTEAAIPSSTLQSEANNGCCNIEEESNAISNCFWEDDRQEYSTNEMMSLEEVNALFDTSPLPDIESVLGYDCWSALVLCH
jgi:hypothetical protein